MFFRITVIFTFGAFLTGVFPIKCYRCASDHIIQHWGRYFSLATEGISEGDSRCKNGPFKKDSYRHCDKPCMLLNVTYEGNNRTHVLGVMRDCSSAYFREPTVKGEKTCTKHKRHFYRREFVEEFCFCITEKCNADGEDQKKTKFFHHLRLGFNDATNSCSLLYSYLFPVPLLHYFISYFVKLKIFPL